MLNDAYGHDNLADTLGNKIYSWINHIKWDEPNSKKLNSSQNQLRETKPRNEVFASACRKRYNQVVIRVGIINIDTFTKPYKSTDADNSESQSKQKTRGETRLPYL